MTKEQRDNEKLIHDYALEPKLVAEGDPFLYRYLTQYKKFSWDTGRVVVQYPSTWRKLIEKLVGDEKRLEVLLAWLPRTQVVRIASRWNDSFTWLENAEQENGLHPFHVILARDNPRNQSNVVRAEDISSGTANSALDDPLPSVTVNRTAAKMATYIEPLLRYATQIHFIDPHFCPLQDRFKNPLRKFLKIICYDSRKVTLEYHTSASYSDAPDWDKFQKDCKNCLPHLIPKGFKLAIRRWKNRKGGERFHNRYILTNIGGVAFGNSIAESPKGEDNISRLSDIDSLRWRNKYSGHSPAFAPEGKIEIEVDLKGGVNIKSNP